MTDKSKGLGDSLEKAFKATKIDKLAKKVLGEDCGCEERKNALNAMFPYFKNIRQFTEDEIKIYEEVMPTVEKRKRVTPEQKVILDELYRRVFGNKPIWKSCTPCNAKIINNLKKVYDKSCKV